MPSRAGDQRTTWSWKRIRKRVLAAQPRCHWCGAAATQVDHLVPVALGGSNALSNLVPACASCNASRGKRLGPPPRLRRAPRRREGFR